jgi:hypothetical protein
VLVSPDILIVHGTAPQGSEKGKHSGEWPAKGACPVYHLETALLYEKGIPIDMKK